jgi:hypothetical protein
VLVTGLGILRFKSLEKKIKGIPLQPLADPEGSRRLRLPDFKTIGTIFYRLLLN